MKNFKMLSKAEMKKVVGGFDCSLVTCPAGLYCNAALEMCVYGDYPSGGTPGGDNGNPCPTYCEPTGGKIFCVGTQNGVMSSYKGNCSDYPWSQVSQLHNVCIAVNGDFWC